MEWHRTEIRFTPQQAADAPRRGEPGIIIPAIATGLMFSPQCIEPGNEVVAAAWLKAVLRTA
jgi:hypothetical protein